MEASHGQYIRTENDMSAIAFFFVVVGIPVLATIIYMYFYRLCRFIGRSFQNRRTTRFNDASISQNRHIYELRNRSNDPILQSNNTDPDSAPRISLSYLIDWFQCRNDTRFAMIQQPQPPPPPAYGEIYPTKVHIGIQTEKSYYFIRNKDIRETVQPSHTNAEIHSRSNSLIKRSTSLPCITLKDI